MDTDSDGDGNHHHRCHQPEDHNVDESSEEEWTYTSARMDSQQQQQQQKCGNGAKMRLNFDNAASGKNDNSTDSDALNGNVPNETDETKVEQKRQAKEINNSDDECNNKDSIQRLIREVSSSFHFNCSKYIIRICYNVRVFVLNTVSEYE